MKESELMIGDWVSVDVCCIPTPHVKVMAISDGYIQVYEAERELSIEEISPIPLTPEILEKNGFVYKKESGLSDLFVCVINNGDYDKTSIVVDIFQEPISGVNVLTNIETACHEGHAVNSIHNCDIEYVHQLQHALRLCGINKEMQL